MLINESGVNFLTEDDNVVAIESAEQNGPASASYLLGELHEIGPGFLYETVADFMAVFPRGVIRQFETRTFGHAGFFV